MSDKTIPFKPEMVRALLAGTKTQTRRLFKCIEDTGDGMFHISTPHGGAFGLTEQSVPSFGIDYLPIAAGDRLWVREHWRTAGWLDDAAPRDLPRNAPIRYEADPVDADNLPLADGRFRPSMFMLRWASRLTLTVTDARVERLQDISGADAKAEGVEEAMCYRQLESVGYPTNPPISGPHWRLGYERLWNAINGPGSWDANPWVAAYTFTVGLHNIDAPNVRQIGDE